MRLFRVGREERVRRVSERMDVSVSNEIQAAIHVAVRNGFYDSVVVSVPTSFIGVFHADGRS